MSEAAWKRVEREVAARLGGRRVPAPGRHGPGADPGDVDGTPFFVEVRARRRCDLFVWWRHTRADAHVAGRVPLLVVKEPRRGGALLAVLRLEDLTEFVPPRARDQRPQAALTSTSCRNEAPLGTPVVIDSARAPTPIPAKGGGETCSAGGI